MCSGLASGRLRCSQLARTQLDRLLCAHDGDDGARSIAPNPHLRAKRVPRDRPAGGCAVLGVEFSCPSDEIAWECRGGPVAGRGFWPCRRNRRANSVNLTKHPRPNLTPANQQRRSDRVYEGRSEHLVPQCAGRIKRQRQNAAEPQHAQKLDELKVAITVQRLESHPSEQPYDAEIDSGPDQLGGPRGYAEVQAKPHTLPRLNANVNTTIAAVTMVTARRVSTSPGSVSLAAPAAMGLGIGVLTARPLLVGVRRRRRT